MIIITERPRGWGARFIDVNAKRRGRRMARRTRDGGVTRIDGDADEAAAAAMY